MDYTILEIYRHNLYHSCFTRAADALFDLADALLTDVSARSFIELSQAASFRRGWPCLYEALEDGRIDRPALIHLFIDLLPQRLVGTRLVLGLDTSSILRPEADTSKDRTLVYRSNLPSDATPVGPGWGGLSDWSAPSGPAGSAPDASRRASLTASRAPGRPWTTGLTDSADGVPSGSSAGKSTALWRA